VSVLVRVCARSLGRATRGWNFAADGTDRKNTRDDTTETTTAKREEREREREGERERRRSAHSRTQRVSKPTHTTHQQQESEKREGGMAPGSGCPCALPL
jgi:hypothetical protein